jgi:hypothetical protein
LEEEQMRLRKRLEHFEGSYEEEKQMNARLTEAIMSLESQRKQGSNEIHRLEQLIHQLKVDLGNRRCRWRPKATARSTGSSATTPKRPPRKSTRTSSGVREEGYINSSTTCNSNN